MTEPPTPNPEPPTTNYQVPPPYPYGYPPVQKTNTMAILALVLVFVLFPAGLIMGYIAQKEIARSGEDGAGLAKAAIIIGWIHVAIIVIFCVGGIALFGFLAATSTQT